MAYEFSPQLEKDFDWMQTRYPTKDAILIPLLQKVQKEAGHLAPEVILYVAQRMNVSPARVKEVASFYSLFYFKKGGKYRVQLCHNLSCYLAGADELLSHLEKKLGIKPGESTEDGLFSLETVECLASCSTGPVLQVNNWDYHERLDLETLDKVIDELKADRGADESYEKRQGMGAVR